jgi:hypothetical protein
LSRPPQGTGSTFSGISAPNRMVVCRLCPAMGRVGSAELPSHWAPCSATTTAHDPSSVSAHRPNFILMSSHAFANAGSVSGCSHVVDSPRHMLCSSALVHHTHLCLCWTRLRSFGPGLPSQWSGFGWTPAVPTGLASCANPQAPLYSRASRPLFPRTTAQVLQTSGR